MADRIEELRELLAQISKMQRRPKKLPYPHDFASCESHRQVVIADAERKLLDALPALLDIAEAARRHVDAAGMTDTMQSADELVEALKRLEDGDETE